MNTLNAAKLADDLKISARFRHTPRFLTLDRPALYWNHWVTSDDKSEQPNGIELHTWYQYRISFSSLNFPQWKAEDAGPAVASTPGRAMIQALERDFDDRDFILLGDFNDNPDDRSLNILETGDPNAPGGPEEIDGPFLSNLTEPLMAVGHVSHGKGAMDIIGDQVNTLDPASRQRNNLARGTNQHTGMIRFDQILIPVRMRERHVEGSTKVFNHASALRGTEQARASDHLPVFADFVFGGAEPPPPPVAAVRILSLLRNPDGPDEGREQVTITNGTAEEVSLVGWTLRDRAGNRFILTGSIPAQQHLTITMREFSMPLNNSGDDVSLVDPQGQVRHHVSYSAAQAQPGQVVTFEWAETEDVSRIQRMEEELSVLNG